MSSGKKYDPSTASEGQESTSSNPFFSDRNVKKGEAINSREDVPLDEQAPGISSRDFTDDLIYQDVEDRTANRKLRQRFAEKAYKVAKYGLYWWATVLLLSAVGNVIGKEVFSDNVLIAVTTASTLNLFAAFLGVIRGLFPSPYGAKD